ncbi:glycosyltransferase [Streptococcus massiliensis]|uniref:Glycosyltransferase teichoic acid biosynthesis protein n=1 Tax=Streptococcus massiliensis TaxID=313439 RepID=A0A380KV17_9STRE|nr:glycosyltransferase [Streptococcus massiliensis]SUN75742.1 glycosyltransferase teichoic acid biosynthesis protein [Streptococcus massiliensis]
MNKLEHTFVLCAYGDSPYLEECIQSLLAQTRKSQIILYTSTPSKHIETICRKYEIPIYVKKGGSIGKDWNNALSCVETKYATIAHQDDYYEQDYARFILEQAEQKEDSIILYSDYFEEKDNRKVEHTTNLKIKSFMLKTMNLFPSSSFWKKRILAFGNAICCPAVTYNLEKLGNFKFDENLRGNLDWIAWYHLAQKSGRFVYVDKKLMCHRIHSDSETSKTIEDNTRTAEDLETLKLFWPNWIAKFIMKFYVKSQNSNG